MVEGLAVVEVSAAERSAEALSPQTLAAATAMVREAGYVLLTGALSSDWCETMRLAWEQQQGGGGDLRWELPIMDRLAVENPWGLQVVEAVMGDDIYVQAPYGTNTLRPDQSWIEINGISQPGNIHVQVVHRDARHPAPGVVGSCELIVMNILLVDFTEQNGGTEIWPGTHVVPDAFDAEMSAVEPSQAPNHAENRGATRPSVRVHAPRGTIIVRDMRLWHRARHNRTSVPRPMLSLVYRSAGSPPPAGEAETMPEAAAARLTDRGRRLHRRNIAPSPKL